MTELLFLGTGAGDWPQTVPPEEVTYTGNRDYRRFSAALVGQHILIDCGPTLLNAMQNFEVDASAITDLLLTHSHWDHLSAGSLHDLLAQRGDAPPLRLWGHPRALAEVPKSPQVVQHPVQPHDTFFVDGWLVEALRANHWVAETAEQPLLYMFTHNSYKWLYGTDTAWLATPTWRRLYSAELDMVVLDATYGDALVPQGQFGHNTLTMIRLIVATMRHDKALTAAGDVWLTHLAKGYHPPHAQLEIDLAPDNLKPAYDGLRITLTD